MADMGTKEAAARWGVTQATVAKWCREGKIQPAPTQDKVGSPWHIEVDAIPPTKNKRQQKIFTEENL